MGLFVGTARLNACHSLTDQLGSAESPIGVQQHSCQIFTHTHTHSYRNPCSYVVVVFCAHSLTASDQVWF